MMIHALDLHGCALVTPRQTPADIWHDLDRVRGLRAPRGRSRAATANELNLAQTSDNLLPQARGRAAGRARPVRKPGAGARRDRGRPRHRQRQAGVESRRKPSPPTPCCRRSPRIPTSRAAASSSPARWSNIRSRSKAMSASTSAPRPAASPKCCSRTAPAWCLPIDVGRGQLHPSLHGHPKIVSMEETDIRKLRGQAPAGAARHRRHRRQLHFAEGRAAGGAVAGGGADASAGADQAAIRGGAKTFQARHHPQRDGAPGNLRRHRGVRGLARLHRHRGVSVARSRAATAISNSSSARAVVETTSSSIMSAIAATASPSPAAKRLRALHARRRDRRGRAGVPAIPTAGGCSRSKRASPERIAPFCPHFGVCGGCAIQHWEAERYRAWKRDIVVETLAQAGIDCEVAPLVDAHGVGRRRITLHARMGTHDVLKVGFAAAQFARHHPDRPLPDPRSRARRRARGGLGAGRAADRDRQAARHPDHRHRERPRRRRARLRAAADRADRKTVRSRRAAPAGAADAPRRTGADAQRRR